MVIYWRFDGDENGHVMGFYGDSWGFHHSFYLQKRIKHL